MFPLPAPTDGDVYLIGALDGGIIFGGQDGLMTQFFEGIGYCEATNYGSYSMEDLFAIGDDFIAIERGSGDRGVRAIRILRE
jgi:hypothetical protein